MKTQYRVLCLEDFALRCKSLRLVVMTVSFYYVNILSGSGCLALDSKGPFRGISLRLVAFFSSSFYDSCSSIPFEKADTELSSKKVYSKLLQSDSSAPILSCQWASFVSTIF